MIKKYFGSKNHQKTKPLYSKLTSLKISGQIKPFKKYFPPILIFELSPLAVSIKSLTTGQFFTVILKRDLDCPLSRLNFFAINVP